MNNLSLDLVGLRTAYEDGVTPLDVVNLVFARIETAGDPGVFISLAPREHARMAAAELLKRARGPLWGVPFVVKDNIDVAGMRTTAACPAFAYEPIDHAPAVAKLIEAGAIFIGKTNLDQFATGLVGVRTPYPAPKNPFDPAIVPGGSSSGSAVAVSRGFASFGLGTDTAGSGRIPAGLNNIVGLKPSLGAISSRGIVPACRTLDTMSLFALTVDDAWRVYEIAAGDDSLDPFSRPVALAALGPVPAKLALGIPREEDLTFFGDSATTAAWEAALSVARSLGASLRPVDMRLFRAAAQLLYEGPWVAERYAATRSFLASHPDAMLPVTRAIIEGALKYSAADAFEGIYELARLKREASAALNAIDALLVPTLPIMPRVADVAADPFTSNARLGAFTNFVNLLDLAALAVPSPMRRDGLPAGVTLIAPRGSDALLASIGRVLHAKADVPMGATGLALPPLEPKVKGPDGMIEIAVVGAHLSGLPLNRQLLTHGAIFRRETKTKPCYRLFALPGGPPQRPGMLQVGDTEGQSIVAEIWALPAEGFGRFVAAIPAPLTIGVVRLAGGAIARGFLVEAHGVANAEDISHFGGWRAYLASRSLVEETQ